jgi:PPP family 3-phenylpropionic acid transporter
MMIQRTDSKLTRQFALLQAAFFAAYSGCSFLSYLLLQKQSFSSALIGVVGALIALSSAAVQPLWGILCDRYRCHRLFYLLSGLLCPVLYWVIQRTRQTPVLLSCAFLSGCFVNCMQNMANGWVAALNGQGHRVSYSMARGCGSISYALAAILYGKAVLLFGNAAIPFLMAVFGLLIITAAFRILKPEAQHSTPLGAREPSGLREGLSLLLRQRDYVVFVSCCFLAVSALSGVSTYFSVFVTQLGGNAQHIGLGNFVLALSEAPAMLLFGRMVKRMPFRILFTLCLAGHVVECVLLAAAPNTACAVLSMASQFLSFGLLVPCVQHFTSTCTEVRYASTAQLFSSAVGLSASMVFGNLFSSFLSRMFPLRTVFLLLGMVAFLGVLLCWFFLNKPVDAPASSNG